MELPTRYPLAAGSKRAFINDFFWLYWPHLTSCYVRKTLINIASMMWLSFMKSPFSVLVSFAVHELIATTRTTQLPSPSPYINVPIMVFRMQPSIVSSVGEAPS